MLVRNKEDLQTDVHIINTLAKAEQLPGAAYDGITMAARIKAYDYCECSAKLNKGIMEVFLTVIQAMMPKIEVKEKKCILQ